jgi:ABC-type transporter Mla subunit MlaD
MNTVLHNALSVFASFWAWAFSLFKDEQVPYVLTMSIAIIFVGLSLWLFIRTKMIGSKLAKLNKNLQKIIGDDPQNWHDNFKGKFNEIENSVQNLPFLKRSWQEFDESVLRPVEACDVFRNTVRAGSYFNISSLAKSAKLPLHVWQAVPNYFVGFGLLFTFLGLAAALNFASSGVSSSDINQAQAALRDLLHAATFKFLTSITGLGASIFFSMLYKWQIGRMQSLMAELSDTLEKGLTYCTQEDIALKQLAETRRQTPLLEYFKTDFAVSVASALQNKMNESLPALFAESMQPLAEELRRLTSSLGQMNMDGLEQMTAQFTEKLHGGAGAEMRAITQTLEAMRDGLSTVSEQMRTSVEKAGGSLEKATAQLESIIAQAGSGFGTSMQHAATDLQTTIARAMTQLQEQLSQAGSGVAVHLTEASSHMDSALKPFAIQMESFTTTLQNFGQEAERQQQALKGMTSGIQNVADDVGSMIDKLQAAAMPVAQTAVQFENTARSIQSTASSIEGIQRQLGAMLATIQESNQKLSETWQSYRQRFEDVDEDLAKAFQTLSTHSQAQLDDFKKYASELDGTLQKALGSLASGIEQMKDAIEDIAEQRKIAA